MKLLLFLCFQISVRWGTILVKLKYEKEGIDKVSSYHILRLLLIVSVFWCQIFSAKHWPHQFAIYTSYFFIHYSFHLCIFSFLFVVPLNICTATNTARATLQSTLTGSCGSAVSCRSLCLRNRSPHSLLMCRNYFFCFVDVVVCIAQTLSEWYPVRIPISNRKQRLKKSRFLCSSDAE